MKQIFISLTKLKFYPIANQLIISTNEKIGWSKTQGTYKHSVINAKFILQKY